MSKPSAVKTVKQLAKTPCKVCSCVLHAVCFGSMCPSGIPLSGQADARLFGAAFAQGEQFPDDFLGFPQDQSGARLQLGVTLLDGQVGRPELGNHGHVQEAIGG